MLKDQVAPATYHHGIATCRVLMEHEPAWAAVELATLFPDQVEGDSGLQEGWNRIVRRDGTERFILVREGEGKITNQPDVPPESIPTVAMSDVRAEESPLWRNSQELAATLLQRARAGTREQIEQVLRDVGRAVTSRTDDFDRQVSQTITLQLAEMQARVRLPQCRVEDLVEPTLDVVRAYLAFAIPGIVAAQVLAYLLSAQPDVARRRAVHPRMMDAEWVPAVEHLVTLSYMLVRDRVARSAPAYYDMTYLAALYSKAAFALTEIARRSGAGPDVLKRLSALGLNIDELSAHNITPTFLPPAAMRQWDLLIWVNMLQQLTGRSIQEIARAHCLYGAFVALLEPPDRVRSMDRDAVEAFYAAYSNAHPGYDPVAALRREHCPVAPVIRDEMATEIGRQTW